MKKLVLAGMLASSLVMGAEFSKAEQVITMQSLESAMGMIQKAFLRDNVAMMQIGVQSLKENLNNIHNFVIKPSVMNEGFDPKAYAGKEVTNLNKIADEILADFEGDKKADARAKYDTALSQCIACHKIIRK